MKSQKVKEAAILCTAGVAALGLMIAGVMSRPVGPDGPEPASSTPVLWLGVILLAAAVIVGGFRYLGARQKAQIQLASQEQYRQMAEEYRRLTDMAITAQEHTDLKLGDVNAQLDYLREQNESVQNILKTVE
jgi:uncharacterized protein HemX